MKILICGTRKKGYKDLVYQMLDRYIINQQPELIIEGCCPQSADQYVEEWCKERNIPIRHFPSTSGNYLNRNYEMVNMLNKNKDIVMAFWDGYSYGTAHTIAVASLRGITTIIYKLHPIAVK